jgi:hypothetical protein
VAVLNRVSPESSDPLVDRACREGALNRVSPESSDPLVERACREGALSRGRPEAPTNWLCERAVGGTFQGPLVRATV